MLSSPGAKPINKSNHMKSDIKYFLKTLLFYAVIPFLVGVGLGKLVKHQQNKQETKEIISILEDFTKQETDLEMTFHVEAKTDEYLLRTYALYESIYQFTRERNLLADHREEFHRACDIMNDIYKSQLSMYRGADPLTAAGLKSIFTLESEHNKKMMDMLTAVTCQETLEIDPGNLEARKTLNQIMKQ